MVDTPNLGLPYILAAQSQKHVTHNEAIRALDAVIRLTVLDRNLATPPATPAEGDRYLVDASPTGAWAGKAGTVAAFQDGAWIFYAPKEGWIAWIADENVAVAYDGAAWTGFTGGGGATTFTTLTDTPANYTSAGGKLVKVNTGATALEFNDQLPLLGINATPDATNKLSVASAATLLTHPGTGGHQVKVNKAATADTASFLFQTGFSGRAEMGTTGDDSFHFKVSPDGTTWKEALVVDKTTGACSFPFTTFGGVGDGDKGDITVTGTGTAWTVDPNTVTNAKLADVPTATIKGRATAGTGDPEDLTVAQTKTLLNLTGTNSGDQTITLTQDVTGAGTGSFATTIAADAVSNAKLANMAANTLKGNNTGAAADPADLTAAQAKTLLAISSSDVPGLGALATASTVNLSTQATGLLQAAQEPAHTGDVTNTAGSLALTIANNAVSNAKAAQMAANTFKANNTGATANAADITAAQAKTLLAISSSDVSGLGTLATASTVNLSTQATGLLQAAQEPAHTGDVTNTAGSLALTIANNAVSNAKAAQMAASTLKGNSTGATANAADLTGTQATALLDVFSSTLKGLAPASGGGTTSFLRADGTWAAPAGGGSIIAQDEGSTLTSGMAQVNFVGAGVMATNTGNNVTVTIPGGSAGSGDVVGPASATDNAITRFNTATGKLVKNSPVLVDDAGVMTLPEATAPATPAADRLSLYATDEDGVTRLEYKTSDGKTIRLSRDGLLVARNQTGSTITRGSVVYINTANTNLIRVALAKADAIATMPAIGLAYEDITNGANGLVMLAGLITSLNTSGFTDGDRVFVSAATAGAFTATEPAHPNLKQRVGFVVNAHASLGSILVAPIGQRGDHEGTNKTQWIVGDGLAGSKDVVFRNTTDATLRSSHTAARTITLPDATGTLAMVGGASGELQYNNAGALAGMANIEHHGGDLIFNDSTPSVPPAGSVKAFGRDVAGRRMLAQMGPSGLDTILQPGLARNKVGYWAPIGNATTLPLAFGIAAPTSGGTATARNVATTNLLQSMKRLGYVTATTAGAIAGARLAVAQFRRGNAAGLGGFTFICRFGVSDAATVAGARMFVGLSASTVALTNVEPNTNNNSVGVGQIAASNNLQIITRDGTTAQTIDLGANFPANTLSADAYELALFAVPNGSSIGYRVERLGTAFVAEGTLTTNLPVNTTLMAIHVWRTNNATALAAGIDLCSLYIETDY